MENEQPTESAPRLESQMIVFGRLRLMSLNEFGEWCAMPVDKNGRDLERAGAVWLFPQAIVTAAEARAAVKGGKA
jgi:hypothetical protein